jgi:invasion protein IalB
MNVLLTTAMTNTKAFDGTDTVGTALALGYTAGINGSRVDQCKIRFTSTNGATASGITNATVIRLFQNNNSVNTTATNNKFIGEISVPAQTVTALATGTMTEILYNLDLDIPASHRIYAGSTTAVGGTACAFLVDITGGDY